MGKLTPTLITIYFLRALQLAAALTIIVFNVMIIGAYNNYAPKVMNSPPWNSTSNKFFIPFICHIILASLSLIRSILFFFINTRRRLDPSLDEMLFLAWIAIDLYLIFAQGFKFLNCSSGSFSQYADLCLYNNITFLLALTSAALWLLCALFLRFASGWFTNCMAPKPREKNMPLPPPPAPLDEPESQLPLSLPIPPPPRPSHLNHQRNYPSTPTAAPPAVHQTSYNPAAPSYDHVPPQQKYPPQFDFRQPHHQPNYTQNYTATVVTIESDKVEQEDEKVEIDYMPLHGVQHTRLPSPARIGEKYEYDHT